MAYEQRLTLADIFQNERIKEKFGLSVKSKTYDRRLRSDPTQTRTAVWTKMDNVTEVVYNAAVTGAAPHYSRLNPSKTPETIIIQGELRGDLNAAFEAVYNRIKDSAMTIKWSANNMTGIQMAFRESEKAGVTGNRPKLWLKEKSVEQILAKNNGLFAIFLNDIMKNIYFGNNYPETKKKVVGDINTFKSRTGIDYNTANAKWAREVNGL